MKRIALITVIALLFHCGVKGKPVWIPISKSNPKNPDDMRLFLNQINIAESDMTAQQRDSTETYDYLIIAGDIPGVIGCQALADFQRWKVFISM